jgi:hypothetical protein
MNQMNEQADDLLGPARPMAPGELDALAAGNLAMTAAKPVFVGPCFKCGGTGQFRRGRFAARCFGCNGTGRKTFAKPAAARAQSRQKAAARKANTAADNWQAFETDQPARAAWVKANPSFEFAQAMRQAVEQYGDLTENQGAAVDRLIVKAEQREAERLARIAGAAPINMDLIEQAFAKAGASLKRPTLRLPGFVISLAPAHGKNAGALYVKAGASFEAEYLGKIQGGKFERSFRCTPEREQEFRVVAADPKEAAIRFGRLTGSCACCGRELTAGESIERGIGPICAGKYGW